MSPYVRTNPAGIVRTRATIRSLRESLPSRSAVEGCTASVYHETSSQGAVSRRPVVLRRLVGGP
jgi:hypothetical protein